MATRSLNKVMLIGNLTRDPELRYTPQGTAVCTMGLATNRTWVTDNGDKKEETEFHRIVAWNKLAELCSQLLFKGRRVYVEGRLQTRQWTGSDGNQRQATEIVIEDMLVLDSKRQGEEMNGDQEMNQAPSEETGIAQEEQAPAVAPVAVKTPEPEVEEKPKAKTKKEEVKKVKAEEVAEDIPF
jgi:single-strand DNA-binding protein